MMRTKSGLQPHPSLGCSIITSWSYLVMTTEDVLICDVKEIGRQGDLHRVAWGLRQVTKSVSSFTPLSGVGYVTVLVTPSFWILIDVTLWFEYFLEYITMEMSMLAFNVYWLKVHVVLLTAALLTQRH